MKKIFLFAITSLVIASCDNNIENQFSNDNAAKVTATIGQSVTSRAEDNIWYEGDEIGIHSIIETLRGPFVNLKYTTPDGDGIFTGDTPIFFYKPMVLAAYYPYTGTEGVAPGSDGIIHADTKIDKQSAEFQSKIDFLWDSRKDKEDFSAGNPNVKFVFSHKMSKLTFTFLKSEPTYDNNHEIMANGVDVGDMVSYEIEGLGLVGTFDTYTGVCSIDEEKEARSKLTVSFPKKTVVHEQAMPSLIVFPQKQPDGGNFTLRVTTDELGTDNSGKPLPAQHYKCVLPFSDKEIKPGCHYKFTIQVTKVGLILGEMSIEEWKTAREWSGTATIDGNIFGTEN